MSLQSNVVARIPDSRLTQLTNRDSNSATAVNGTVLGLACTDVAAWFATYTGRIYDDTIPGDVAAAVSGVEAVLQMWASGDRASFNNWKAEAIEYGKTTGRDRILWATSSEMTPTTDDPEGTGEVRPAFDDEAFDGYKPLMP